MPSEDRSLAVGVKTRVAGPGSDVTLRNMLLRPSFGRPEVDPMKENFDKEIGSFIHSLALGICILRDMSRATAECVKLPLLM